MMQEFCSELTSHLTNSTWTVGELFLVDQLPMAMKAHADFLDQQGAHSVFAFPMASAVSKAFRVSVQTVVSSAQAGLCAAHDVNVC
jgi:hypothetical protein